MQEKCRIVLVGSIGHHHRGLIAAALAASMTVTSSESGYAMGVDQGRDITDEIMGARAIDRIGRFHTIGDRIGRRICNVLVKKPIGRGMQTQRLMMARNRSLRTNMRPRRYRQPKKG